MKAASVAIFLGVLPGSAMAFDVMDPKAIAPILDMTKANWVALRSWEGDELLYFTQIESWRCAVAGVSYAVNGGAWLTWNLAPCQVGTPSPNALPEDHLPFIKLPADLLRDITIRVEMTDGQVLQGEYARSEILMP